MITKDIKISKLLKEYPGSLEVLLKASPHFSKLENKLLRKALAGRVTVEQAASIAGVDLENLLTELNSASSSASLLAEGFAKVGSSLCNEDSKAEGKNLEKLKKEKPVFLKPLNKEKIITFDVRPILDSGKDPLQNILSKIKELKIGEALLIINSFEPIPLYSLLAKKGFLHWMEKSDELFKIYFYKENGDENILENSVKDSEEKLAAKINTELNEHDFENIIEIDVHELQPPEPMMKILESLNRIDEKSVMLVYHHREPVLLYPILEERGYRAVCKKLDEDNYKILISKKQRQ